MKPGWSIAWRIRCALTALTTLALLLAGVLTFYTYLRMEAGMVADLTVAEAERMHTRLTQSGRARWEEPFERWWGPALFVWGESAQVPAPTLPPELRGLAPGTHLIEREQGNWHVMVSVARDGHLYVMYDTALLDRRHGMFAALLAGIVLVFSLIAFLISGRIARWLVAPLETLTGRLTRWVPQQAAPQGDAANEAERLLEVFNRVQDQVDSAIADQKEFSANLHHEIRNPLAIIRSDAEVMAMSPRMDPADVQQRLQRIVGAVNEIGQSLETTWGLAQARAEDALPVRVHACVDDVIASLRLRADGAGLVLRNLVDPGQEETVSRIALLTVVRNIIRNAVAHAAPAELSIESVVGGLRFTDTGPGIPPTQQAHIFDRYFSRRSDLPPQPGGNAASGMERPGLGLAIAKRVCVIQSWWLEVESPVEGGHGTRFILRFRAEDSESAQV